MILFKTKFRSRYLTSCKTLLKNSMQAMKVSIEVTSSWRYIPFNKANGKDGQNEFLCTVKIFGSVWVLCSENC